MKTDATTELTSTVIDLLRHAECEGGQIFRGRTNVNLTPAGLSKMHRRAKALATQWDIIVTSPLVRCHQFAAQYSEQKKIPLIVDDRLQEISFGIWEGLDVQKLFDSKDATLLAWQQNPELHTPPEGEPLKDVKQRASDLLNNLQEQYAGKRILLVSHGGFIRVVLSILLDMPLSAANRFDVPYACMSRFAFYRHQQQLTTKLLSHNAMQI